MCLSMDMFPSLSNAAPVLFPEPCDTPFKLINQGHLPVSIEHFPLDTYPYQGLVCQGLTASRTHLSCFCTGIELRFSDLEGTCLIMPPIVLQTLDDNPFYQLNKSSLLIRITSRAVVFLPASLDL